VNVQAAGNTVQSLTVPTSSKKLIVEPAEGKTHEVISKHVKTDKQLHDAGIQGLKISVGEEQLIKAIDRAIKALEGPTTTFEIKVHDQTNVVTVKVFNKDTGELIREIPPEKTLDLVVKMMEIAGILVDEKV
jgi:flagellar protein FlaG